MYAKRFSDLVVYQKAKVVSQSIFLLTRSFPKEEMFSLTDQIRRSSRSIGAQLAEAWAKRRYEKHFVSKLTDADGEQLETQHWINEALSCGYLSSEQASALMGELQSIGKMLSKMMAMSESFCQDDVRSVHESSVSYDAVDTFFAPASTDHRSPVTGH
jgi:four helix bundle protein